MIIGLLLLYHFLLAHLAGKEDPEQVEQAGGRWPCMLHGGTYGDA